MAQVLDEPPVAAEKVQINLAATPAATPLPGGVPPLSSLKDEYSALYSTYSHFCDKPRGSPGDGTNLPYFDAEELAKLSPQNPPVDHFLASNNVEHGEFVTSFCCCNGEPYGPVKIPKDVEAAPGSQPPSLAETVYGFADDGLHHGVSSCDELLHEDSSGGELMKFFNTFNSKPLWKMTVSGSHSVRTVHHGTDDDNNPTTTERYSTREDFKHEVDVSHFISPFGLITTDNDMTVEKTIQDFLKDSNGLKNIRMNKEVNFDFEHLRCMVHGYIRSLGYIGNISVALSIGNFQTIAYKKNCWTSLYSHCLARFFLCYLPLCIPLYIMARIQQQHRKHIKSYFRVDAHPLQVLESIKPELEAVKMASVTKWTVSNRFPHIWNGKEGFDSGWVIAIGADPLRGGIVTELTPD
ncbi:hypothetical protein TeGR_g5462 [Tetraparma gracilis]|uniref:Uncharacterized protein n=1 Tax=Tetraparma gracilis TaxID=2962635 RepID=A0ABQ6MGS1_9STRA|nr:hypothetical protein TeGR_g5462 [Tetraparma gracilis]